MSRPLTFSRTFPAYHPKAGHETFFVQKFLSANRVTVNFKPNEPTHFYPDPKDLFEMNNHLPHDLISQFIHSIDGYSDKFEPKYHTIRSGNRWKVGDKFSPRVWSGKPYRSKQIIIAPDIEIKKVWTFEISVSGYCALNENYKPCLNAKQIIEIAKNDGLSENDFLNWFQYPKPFTGQIICWNENIKY